MNLFNTKADIRFISLALAICFPILKFSIASMSIIIFAAISTITFFYSKEQFSKKNIIYFFVGSSYLVILLFTLAYSSNIKDGWRLMQHGLSIIIFPATIFFFNKDFSSKRLREYLFIFCIACFICTLYIYIELIYQGVFSKIFTSEVEFWNHPYREILLNLKYLDLHPSYYSTWILFSAIFLIDNIFNEKRRHMHLFSIGLIIFFVFTAILFSARAPLLGFALAAFFLLIFKIKSHIIKIITATIFLIVVIVSITQISFLKSRFIDELNAQEYRPPVGFASSSTNIRVGIYKCSWEIFNDHKWIGVGVGDVMDQLNSCYKQFHTRLYEEKDYNTHNTYMHVLLSGGIFALGLFLATLFYQIRLALLSKNYLYLSFLILVMTCLLFENMLSRMHGALFYSLFNAIFIKYFFSEKKE